MRVSADREKDDNGALGRSTTAHESQTTEELETRPTLVDGLDGLRVVRVYAGDSFSVALTEEGQSFCRELVFGLNHVVQALCMLLALSEARKVGPSLSRVSRWLTLIPT